MSAGLATGVALAGASGAVVRYVFDGFTRRHRTPAFPYATLLINVSGSLVLGVLTGIVLYHATGTDLRIVAGTGFCGGYTTFSTTSYDTVQLIKQSRGPLAAANAIGTLALTLLAALAGLALGSLGS